MTLYSRVMRPWKDLATPRRVDLRKTCAALHTRSIELADEEELNQLFGDCELGVIPPFGSQYGTSSPPGGNTSVVTSSTGA